MLAGYPSYVKTGRRRALEEAQYVEEVVTNMEGISKNKASLAEYRYKFGITRPVPVIVNGALRLTTKVSRSNVTVHSPVTCMRLRLQHLFYAPY